MATVKKIARPGNNGAPAQRPATPAQRPAAAAQRPAAAVAPKAATKVVAKVVKPKVKVRQVPESERSIRRSTPVHSTEQRSNVFILNPNAPVSVRLMGMPSKAPGGTIIGPMPPVDEDHPDRLLRMFTPEGAFAKWQIPVRVAQYVGIGESPRDKFTFILGMPTEEDDRNYDDSTPYGTLFSDLRAAARALESKANKGIPLGPQYGKFDESWARLVPEIGKGSFGKAIPMPTTLHLMMCVVYMEKGASRLSQAGLPDGLSPSDPIPVMPLTHAFFTSALSPYLQIPEEGAEESEDPHTIYRYADLVDLNRRHLIGVHEENRPFGPEYDDDIDPDYAPTYGATAKNVYLCRMLSKFLYGRTRVEPSIEAHFDAIYNRVPFWSQIIYPMQPEEQVELICRALQKNPDVVRWWLGNHAEYHSEVADGILNSRETIDMGAAPGAEELAPDEVYEDQLVDETGEPVVDEAGDVVDLASDGEESEILTDAEAEDAQVFDGPADEEAVDTEGELAEGAEEEIDPAAEEAPVDEFVDVDAETGQELAVAEEDVVDEEPEETDMQRKQREALEAAKRRSAARTGATAQAPAAPAAPRAAAKVAGRPAAVAAPKVAPRTAAPAAVRQPPAAVRQPPVATRPAAAAAAPRVAPKGAVVKVVRKR